MIDFPMGEAPSLNIRDYTKADWKYEIIMEEIETFAKDLDENQAISMTINGYAGENLFSITEISYRNPDIIIFSGVSNSKKVSLFQHVSQINFLLTSCEKSDPNHPTLKLDIARPESDS